MSLVFVTRHRRWCSRVEVPAVGGVVPLYMQKFQSINLKLHEALQTARSTLTATAVSSVTVRSIYTEKKPLHSKTKTLTDLKKLQLRRLENSCVPTNVLCWRQAVPDKNEPGWFDATRLGKMYFPEAPESTEKKKQIKQIQKDIQDRLQSILK